MVVVLPAYPLSTLIFTDRPDSPFPLASFRYPVTVTLPDEPVMLVIVIPVPMRVEVEVVVDELVPVLAVTVTVLVLVVFTTVVQTP